MLACKHGYFYPPAMHTEQHPDLDTCVRLGHVTVRTAQNLATQPQTVHPVKTTTESTTTKLPLFLARISHYNVCSNLMLHIFHATVKCTQTLTSNLLHNIYHLFTAPICFSHRIWPSSGSCKLLSCTQHTLQVKYKSKATVLEE